MPFNYERTIRFADTDAAAVVYFANYLSICHEAYEEALAQGGIDLNRFFSAHEILVPVSRSQADYLRPLACGDRLRVSVVPRLVSDTTFAVNYEVFRLTGAGKLASRVVTEHVCIDAKTRERRSLPEPLRAWIEATAAADPS